MIYWCTMKTQNSQEPPPVSAWMEDALAMMELSAEVTAALAAAVGEEGEDCPNCDNVGWYAMMNRSSNPWEAEQVQCEWCYTVQNSKFNRRLLAVAAVSHTEKLCNSPEAARPPRESKSKRAREHPLEPRARGAGQDGHSADAVASHCGAARRHPR